ncbi:MAG: DUF4276 family protein [Cytophagia bacterium]|nr:MAG: DUF4276 family protein [Cytophagia bacterium]TAG39546.1 MAG: DUF4276 family protein [Cytophagia bacterium]
MKKIAFYVEGQTEQFFINKLLIEIAGKKKIEIELQQFQGVGKPTKSIYPKTTAQPQNPQHFALIFDCMGDGGVKPRILQDAVSLFNQGYSEIVGLIDFYSPPQRTTFTLADLSKFENELSNGTVRNERRITQPLPNDTSIVIAVREIEDWFLAECNHYACIDASITLDTTQIASLGFNPCVDDLTLRATTAFEDLKSVYKLVGKTYRKKKDKMEETVERLDYANLYINL